MKNQCFASAFTTRYRQAFTLVELSIVLVILGLLVGGVLAGQSLIRAAELRSVTAQYNSYLAAVHSFRDKYFALPGDMTNATSFWGTAAACPGTAATGSTTAATCNGNGNGSVYPTTAYGDEVFRFWHHLANAGLIEGSYNGVTSNDAYWWTVTYSNSPRSKLSSAVWTTVNVNQPAGGFTGNMPYQNLGNLFLVGGIVTNSWPYGGILLPEEAWNIDTKLDDGLAIRGKVMSSTTPSCTNVADGSNTAAAYLLTSTAKACFLIFVNAF